MIFAGLIAAVSGVVLAVLAIRRPGEEESKALFSLAVGAVAALAFTVSVGFFLASSTDSVWLWRLYFLAAAAVLPVAGISVGLACWKIPSDPKDLGWNLGLDQLVIVEARGAAILVGLVGLAAGAMMIVAAVRGSTP